MRSPASSFRVGLACTAFGIGLGIGNAVRTQQYAWQPGPEVIPLGTPTIAYDAMRQRIGMVISGGLGTELWEGDGAAWTKATVGGPLAARFYPNLAFDSARGALLMFGGAVGTAYQNDLWSWNGAAWAPIVTTQAPPPRNSPVMVYDEVRARLVLYGGYITAPVDETWEFDGTTWAQQFPVNRPTARLGHALAFDQARGTTLLFGGYAQSQQQVLAETWSWNGFDWTRQLPAQAPPQRRSGGLVYDSARSRVVLTGGTNSSTALADTWDWDGTNWSQVATTSNPPATGFPQVCFDAARGETVLVENGVDGARTWAFDGSNWTLAIESTNPSLRDHHAIAYDPVRDSAVTFGGVFTVTPLDHTWEFRGGVWQRMLPPTKPSAREFAALAFDPSSQQMLLFGGRFTPNDTWLYDGASWTQRQPATRPPARFGHAMATDTGRGRVVLFGGAIGFNPMAWSNDTWEWDGVTWLQRTPPQVPPVRTNHAMAYDPLRARTVLYGGGDIGMTPAFADQWEWDGSAWAQIAVSAAPGQRVKPGLVFDDVVGRIVLFGGFDVMFSLPFPRNDTWEWNGATWTPRNTANPPWPRAFGAVTWLTSSRRLLLNGGDAYADTWLLGGASIASVTPYGSPCTGSAAMPALRTVGLPLRDNRWFQIQLSSVPANAPVVLGVSFLPTNAPAGGGCTALVDQAGLVWQVADARGSCRFALPIPNAPALHGAAVFAQGLAFDNGGALAGLMSLSAALRIVID